MSQPEQILSMEELIDLYTCSKCDGFILEKLNEHNDASCVICGKYVDWDCGCSIDFCNCLEPKEKTRHDTRKFNNDTQNTSSIAGYISSEFDEKK